MTLQLVLFAALFLCVYRATRFVTTDTFPPVAWLRARVLESGSDWGEGITCPHCVSLWLAIAGVWLANVWLPIRYPWLEVGAVAGAVSLIAGGFDD